MNSTQAILAIVVMAVVTAALRFIPFLIFRDKDKTPKIVTYLGQVLPCAIMGMLVVYCLRGVSFGSVSGFLPELIAGTLVVVLYVWKRSTLLSIISGTLCYMLLVQFVF